MILINRLYSALTSPLGIILYTLLVLISFFYFDKPLAIYFHDLNITHNYPIVKYITQLGLGVIYLFLFFIAALIGHYIYKNQTWAQRAWFIFIAIAIPCIICTIIKIIIGRARPDLLFSDNIYGFYGFNYKTNFLSFPSGHTTVISAVVLSLGIIFPRFSYPLLFCGIIVAITRIMLIRHYLSDILVAFYLTVIEIKLILNIFQAKGWLKAAWQHNKIFPRL